MTKTLRKPHDKDQDMQYLLQHLTEECAEVIQAISKIKRFGLKDIYTRNDKEVGVTNQEKFEQEVIQLVLILEELEDKYFVFNINEDIKKYLTERRNKWKKYSQEVLG